MSSVNLSFKVWPFTSVNKTSENKSLKTPSITTKEIEKIGSSIPYNYFIPSNIYLNIKSAKPIKTNDENFTLENNYSINKSYHLSSWGRCGLFANTNESSLSIYSNDEKGNMTPMFMFSPFENLTTGKINKQQQKSSYITAIGWSDGHLHPRIPKPILAVSSENGQFLIYDFYSKRRIGSFLFNEPIVSILWSSIKQNRFYAGSSTGHFYICEVSKKTIKILKVFDFYSNSIDFITQDDVDGTTLAIASKDGSIGFITNVKDPIQSKIQIYQNFNLNETKQNSDDNIINFFEFYPNNQDFITIATNSATFLISISKSILIPFIQTSNCKFISLINNENDKVIIGDESEIVVWKLVDQFWIRSFNLKIGKKEILTFSKHNNKVLLTTNSNWLTEIEYKRNKVFVSKRIRLIDGIPIDYGFCDGSIAFLTSNNSILLTSKENTKIIDQQQDLSDESSQALQCSENSNTDDYSDAPLFIGNETEGSNLNTSKSMTIEISSDSIKQDSDLELHSTKSESNIFTKNFTQKSKHDDSLCGNSNSFEFSFMINENIKLKHIEWINSQQIITWCKKSIYLIDLQKRTVTEPLLNRFCKKSFSITQLFFSKSRRIICLILNNKHAYFLNTESNFDIIDSIDFTEKVKNEKVCIIGSISPNENHAVFASSKSLFLFNLNEKESLKEIKPHFEYDISFISWENRGILIGTENGCALLFSNKNVSEMNQRSTINMNHSILIYDSHQLFKKKLGAIKQISPCSNKRFIIIDSNNQGIIAYNDAQMIAENIKSFKQYSKDTFLVRFQNCNKLVVFNTFGNFIPSLPPCFFSMKTNKTNLYESLKYDNNLIDSITQQMFLLNQTNNPIIKPDHPLS